MITIRRIAALRIAIWSVSNGRRLRRRAICLALLIGWILIGWRLRCRLLIGPRLIALRLIALILIALILRRLIGGPLRSLRRLRGFPSLRTRGRARRKRTTRRRRRGLSLSCRRNWRARRLGILIDRCAARRRRGSASQRMRCRASLLTRLLGRTSAKGLWRCVRRI